MSNARQILDERLAKGEISEEEYDHLISKLAPEVEEDSATKPAVLDSATSLSKSQSGKNWAGWVVVGVIGLGIYLFINSLIQGRTHINNLRATGFFGDIVSGELITEGSSGQVYVWIEKGGKTICPRSVFLQQNRPRQFKFQCHEMGRVSGNNFTLKTNRSPKEWIRKNAKSL
ncbi:MAG: SHOCT domain-containing protein [Pseudomonadota bacterium]